MDKNVSRKLSQEGEDPQLGLNELPDADLAHVSHAVPQNAFRMYETVIKCSVHFETLEGIRRHADRIGEQAQARETTHSSHTEFKTEDLRNVSDITQGISGMEIAPVQFLRQNESGAVGKIKRKTLSNPSYFHREESSTSMYQSTGYGNSAELPSSLISGMSSLDINHTQRFNEWKRSTMSRKERSANAVMKYQHDVPRRDSRRAVEFNRHCLYSMNYMRRESESPSTSYCMNYERRELDAPSTSYCMNYERRELNTPPSLYSINHERSELERERPCLCGVFPAQPIRYHDSGLRRSNSFTVASLDLSVRASRRSSFTATSQHAEPEGVIYPSERNV